MNNAPIGIFDSGVGGLSVLKEIRALLPHEDLIYIADSSHAPYGNKSIGFIQQRSHALTQFLIEQGVKAVVVACNTATAAAVASLRQQFAVTIVAMEPGVKPAITASKNGRIGVLATENTLSSEQFLSLVHRYAVDVEVFNQPCPGLVEQIEAGELESLATKKLLEQFIQPLLENNIDTLVLGCTHYPLLRPQIETMVDENTTVIDTGRAVAQQLKRRLTEDALLTHNETPGTEQFWSTASQKVTPLIQRLWRNDEQKIHDINF